MLSLNLVAAFDVFGENRINHLERLLVTLGVNDIGPGAVRFEGNDVDALKLSQIVGEVTDVAWCVRRENRNKSDITAGKRIWTAVFKRRRFCSSQFFHNIRPNCSALDTILSSVADALSSISTHTTSATNSVLPAHTLGVSGVDGGADCPRCW